MKYSRFIFYKIFIFLGAFYVIYKLIPNFDELPRVRRLQNTRTLGLSYQKCLQLPYSEILNNLNKVSKVSIIWPSTVSTNILLELQTYDLCMRRYDINTEVGAIKKNFILKYKILLYIGKMRPKRFSELQQLLFQFYPDYFPDLQLKDFEVLKKNVERLDIPELIYLCIATKQYRQAAEGPCMKYEGKENLIEIINNG